MRLQLQCLSKKDKLKEYLGNGYHLGEKPINERNYIIITRNDKKTSIKPYELEDYLKRGWKILDHVKLEKFLQTGII